MNNKLKIWIKAATIRSIKTMAQTALSLISTTAVVLNDINWSIVFSSSILAGFLSLLTSIVTGLPEVKE